MGAPVLNCEAICIIGKKLMLSGALMEAGFASFVQAESEKLEALVPLVDDTAIISPEQLIQVNKDVAAAIEAIKGVEELIIHKIEKGNTLYEIGKDGDKCPCTTTPSISCPCQEVSSSKCV